MAAPRVTIPELPEQTAPVDSDLLVVQNGTTTKKMTVGRLTTQATNALSSHISNPTAAHAATAISAVPNAAPLIGTDVQAQLAQAGSQINTNTAAIGNNTTALNNHVASVSAHSAANITADNTGRTYVTGANVDAQMDAVDARFVTLAAVAAPVPTARKINTLAPLSGGGDLSADRTLTISAFTSSASGIVPPSGGDASVFLCADGTWKVPASASGAPIRRPLNSQTGTTYAPVAVDENTMVTLANAAAITVTMPSDATQAFPIGAEVDFLQLGAGQVTFAAGSGATVNGTPSLKTRAQYSACTAKKIAANAWVMIGDMA